MSTVGITGMTSAQYLALKPGDKVRYLGPGDTGLILEVAKIGKIGAHPHSIPTVTFQLGDEKFPTAATTVELHNFEVIA